MCWSFKITVTLLDPPVHPVEILSWVHIDLCRHTSYRIMRYSFTMLAHKQVPVWWRNFLDGRYTLDTNR